MALAFDPYHKWLGIPPAEQPPNHYRLLAINPFESDPDVIEGAADQRMVHLRSLQTGQHADLTQELLNKISAAKLCLLRPDKKKEYDDQLRARQVRAAPPPVPPGPPPGAAIAPAPPSAEEHADTPVVFQAAAPVVAGPLDFINAAPSSKSGVWEPEPLPVSGRGTSYKARSSGYSSGKAYKSPARKSPTPMILAFVAVVAVVGIGLIIYAMNQGGGNTDQANSTSVASDAEKHTVTEPPVEKPPKVVPHSVPPKNPPPPSNPGNEHSNPNPHVTPVVETTHPSSHPKPDKPDTPKPPDNPPPAPVKPPPEPVETRKAVPDQAAQTKAVATVHEVLKDDYAKALTPEARASLVRKLIKLASETNDDPNLRYVMGTQAVELAVKAGETDLAFEAIDGMNAYFAVDGWDLKAKALLQLSHQAKSLPSRKEVAAQALTMTDGALSAERYEAAAELASIATTMSDLLGDPLLREQAREAHARALRMQNLAQEYKTAKEKLATHPDDAEANLSVGRYLCFQKDDWKAGVPYLAKSNDETLKTLAGMESNPPTDVSEQMKLADAWWTAAEKSADKTGTVGKPMFARAKYWYREALPGLSGFALEKAQKRASDESGAEIGNAKLVFLDDLPEQDVSMGVGSLGKHGATGLPSDQPQEVVFRGVPTKHALAMQPPDDGISKASFVVDRKFHNFVSTVGLLDGSKPERPVTFEVRGDDKLLWASRLVHNSSESYECNVAVSNFKTLQLIVRCSGKSDGCRAIWVNPLLKK
jgi:hypothetical protein